MADMEKEDNLENNGIAADEVHITEKTKKKRGVLQGRVLTVLLIFLLIVAIVIIIVLAIKHDQRKRKSVTIVIGAVVSDNEACSDIGKDMLTRGGTATDAAIATLLCVGLVSPHSMGIGGGFFGVVTDQHKKSAEYFDARETAPAGLTEEFFRANLGDGYPGRFIGVQKIGVPGEIIGYWDMHQTYGKLPWKELFQPIIKLANEGYYVSNSLARALKILSKYGVEGKIIPGFCEVYCNKSGLPLVEGDVTTSPKLAKTLEGIANQGPSYMYGAESSVTKAMVNELNAAGGRWTVKDFADYKVVRGDALSVDLGDVVLKTLDAPSGGPVLGLILNILRGLDLSEKHMEDDPAMVYHMMIEAIKIAYGDRADLADPAFVPNVTKVVERMKSAKYAENLRKKMDLKRTHNSSFYTTIADAFEEYGTAHVSVLGPEGDAVSVTSTVNTYFGSLVISNSTGIIWNNEMTDFTVTVDKQQHINGIEPGKRPLSSMVPAIFLDKSGSVRLVLGAAGGSRITNTVAQIAARVLFMKQPIDVAIRKKRFHHQLKPNELKYEYGFPKDILQELQNKYGHKVKRRETYLAVAEGIHVAPKTGTITAFADERKIPGKATLLTKTMEVYV